MEVEARPRYVHYCIIDSSGQMTRSNSNLTSLSWSGGSELLATMLCNLRGGETARGLHKYCVARHFWKSAPWWPCHGQPNWYIWNGGISFHVWPLEID